VKLARSYALVRLTVGLQGKDYDEAAKSAAAAEAYRLSLERCVARELKVLEEECVSLALLNLAPTSQAPWSPLLADVKLLTDQSGRDSRDAAALSRSLRERVGNPMSELAQKFAATRAQLLSLSHTHPHQGSELEALDVSQARGAPRQEALVVIGGEGGGAGERPRPLSEAVSVTRQSPPIFASTAVGPRACSPRERNTLYASCPGGAGFHFVVPERVIEVEVEGAAHLPSMHLWTSASCQLELASSVLNHQQVQRTHVVERSCEPKWRRTLRLAAMCLQSDMLRVSVLHEGSAGMREVIGEVWIEVGELCKRSWGDAVWPAIRHVPKQPYLLLDTNGKPVRGEYGQALVNLSFHMALPPQRMVPLHGWASVKIEAHGDWERAWLELDPFQQTLGIWADDEREARVGEHVTRILRAKVLLRDSSIQDLSPDAAPSTGSEVVLQASRLARTARLPRPHAVAIKTKPFADERGGGGAQEVICNSFERSLFKNSFEGSVSLFGARDSAHQPLLLQGLILICPTDQEANEAWLTRLKAATATLHQALAHDFPPPQGSNALDVKATSDLPHSTPTAAQTTGNKDKKEGNLTTRHRVAAGEGREGSRTPPLQNRRREERDGSTTPPLSSSPHLQV